MTTKNVSAGTRIGSMVLDHIFMTMIAMVFFIPSIVKGFSGLMTVSHEQRSFTPFHGGLAWLGIIGFALYFCKDCINGRSIAKRINRLQVVSNSTGLAASPLQCLIRNIFCVIWPIEVIVTLINPSRRIGDMVAGTKVVAFDPMAEQPKTIFLQVAIALLLSIALLSSIAVLFKHVLPKQHAAAPYVTSSYNDKESKELEKLLSNAAGQYLVPSVRVYDSISKEPLKYISVICQFKENYFQNGGGVLGGIEQLTTNVIYQAHPQNTFKGRIQYYYQSNGSMNVEESAIGDYDRAVPSTGN